MRTQFFYVHLPKCAGTAVLKSLQRVGKQRHLVLSESPSSKQQAKKNLIARLEARGQTIEDVDLIIGHDVFSRLEAESRRPSFFFTVLRHPVQRYISHFRYFVDCAKNRRSPIHDFAKQKMAPDGKLLSLEEAIDRKYWCNLMTNYLASAHHPDLTKGRWQVEDDQKLPYALDFVHRMDFLGFVDSLESDVATICELLGLRRQLKVVNRSKSKILDPISKEIVKKIEANNELDVLLYADARQIQKSRS